MLVSVTAQQTKKMPRKKTVKQVIVNQDAMKHCFREGYKIYPITKDNVTYQVEVTKGNQEFTYPDVYDRNKIHQAISDVYDKIYNRHLKQKQ